MIRTRIVIALAAAWWVLGPAPVVAQPTGSIPPVFEGVGITEKLGERIPLELAFADETGQPVTLGRYFDGERPVLLNLVYHECPMLCSLLLTEFTKTLAQLDWVPGSEYEVVTVSFSATEDADIAQRAKDRYIGQLGRPEAAEGWHFLTGSDESILALAEAVGFGFKWVEETREFAHPAALMFVSPDGVLSRYIHGIGYEAPVIRKALVEASEGRIGTTVDQILMYCYRYDAEANSYVLHAQNLMRLGGGLALALLALTLLYFWRRERHQLNHAPV